MDYIAHGSPFCYKLKTCQNMSENLLNHSASRKRFDFSDLGSLTGLATGLADPAPVAQTFFADEFVTAFVVRAGTAMFYWVLVYTTRDSADETYGPKPSPRQLFLFVGML